MSVIEEGEFEYWKKSILLISLFQAVIVIPTLIPFLKFYLPTFNNEPIGTIGNSDFLATLFGSTLFYLSDLRFSKKKYFLNFSILFLGLLATMSKGTILLIIGILAFKKWPKIIVGISIPVLFVFTWFFSSSLLGRIQLWLSALKVWKDHFLIGIGGGKFSSGYFNANKELMNLGWYISKLWILELSGDRCP